MFCCLFFHLVFISSSVSRCWLKFTWRFHHLFLLFYYFFAQKTFLDKAKSFHSFRRVKNMRCAQLRRKKSSEKMCRHTRTPQTTDVECANENSKQNILILSIAFFSDAPADREPNRYDESIKMGREKCNVSVISHMTDCKFHFHHFSSVLQYRCVGVLWLLCVRMNRINFIHEENFLSLSLFKWFAHSLHIFCVCVVRWWRWNLESFLSLPKS